MLDRIVSSAKKAKHDSAIIGEVWEDATNKIAYGQRRRYFLGGQLDSVMNYCLKDALIDFVRNGNVNRLKGVMFDILNNYPKKVVNNLMCLIDSHDTARALTAISDQVYAPNTPKEVYADRRLTGEEYNRGLFLKMCVLLQYTMIGFP